MHLVSEIQYGRSFLHQVQGVSPTTILFGSGLFGQISQSGQVAVDQAVFCKYG